MKQEFVAIDNDAERLPELFSNRWLAVISFPPHQKNEAVRQTYF